MTRSARTGIVLAGGRSSRFGGDKLAAQVDGEPLLWRPIRAMAAAGCGSILVVITPELDEPTLPPELRPRLRLVRDPESYGGPLIGLRTGLAAAPPSSVAIVSAGDQPGLRPALLRALVEARSAPMDAGLPGGRTRAAVVLVDPNGVTRPLPCVVDRDRGLAAADRLIAGGERRLRALLAALDAREVLEAVWRATDPSAAWTLDIDRPEDLQNRH